MSTSPTGAQLRVLHNYGLTTRLVKGPRKGIEEGKGWGRICTSEGCRTQLNHLNEESTCGACQLRERKAA